MRRRSFFKLMAGTAAAATHPGRVRRVDLPKITPTADYGAGRCASVLPPESPCASGKEHRLIDMTETARLI